MLQSARSFLFVPGDRPERFEKAANTAADCIVLDLEDAVSPDNKGAARDAVLEWLQSRGGRTNDRVIVRVNDAASKWFEADCRAFGQASLAGIMLPKAESVDILSELAGTISRHHQIVPLIETVRGWDNMRQIGQSANVARLAFGSVDFCVDAGISGEQEELDFVRSSLVLNSRLAGLPAPIDGVSTDFKNTELLIGDVRRSRQFGFGAKLCIHPAQVDAVNVGYAPDPEEIAWARRVVAAVKAGGLGAISVDGKLIDKPLHIKAAKVLDSCQNFGVGIG